MAMRRRRMNMAKYIDREALVDWLKRIPLKDLSDGLGLCRVIMEDDFKKAIKEMPEGIIADAVLVVRCRECKHHHWEQEPCHGKTVHYCDLPHMRGVEVFKEFFCYYGDPKEGAD